MTNEAAPRGSPTGEELIELIASLGEDLWRKMKKARGPGKRGRPREHDDDLALFFVQWLVELGAKRGAAVTRVTGARARTDSHNEYHQLNIAAKRREDEFREVVSQVTRLAHYGGAKFTEARYADTARRLLRDPEVRMRLFKVAVFNKIPQ